MKNKFLTLIVLAIAIVSCNKSTEKTTEATENQPAVEVPQNFYVELDVLAEKKDDFALYYTEDSTINFTSDKTVWAGVEGQPGSQKITLNLSEEIVPTDIRIDFGIKKGQEQGDVTLEKFKMNFYGKSFEFKGSDFFNYFIPNDNVETKIDAAKGTITFLKNPSKQDTPFYYPKQTLLDQIALITK
jgi:hypothetical protein